MERYDIGILIFGLISCIALGQVNASGNIGNRSYSLWYCTHFLVEKKGLCKLIYFKPKHFDRYTLYEVVSFFSSYFSILVFAMLGVFRSVGLLNQQTLSIIIATIVGLLFFSQLPIVLINDIGSHRDEKKKIYLETGERETCQPIPDSSLPKEDKFISKIMQIHINSRNNSYFTIHILWDSYRIRLKEAGKDVQKRNRVNLDYIEYFKNIDHLVVIKENKSGSLQLKINK